MTDEERAEYEARGRRPGKFQGEPGYAVWLWETRVMEGLADDRADTSTTEISAIFVTDEDRAEWPALSAFGVVALWESDTGFVYRKTFASVGAWEQWAEDLDHDSEQAADMEGGM